MGAGAFSIPSRSDTFSASSSCLKAAASVDGLLKDDDDDQLKDDDDDQDDNMGIRTQLPMPRLRKRRHTIREVGVCALFSRSQPPI